MNSLAARPCSAAIPSIDSYVRSSWTVHSGGIAGGLAECIRDETPVGPTTIAHPFTALARTIYAPVGPPAMATTSPGAPPGRVPAKEGTRQPPRGSGGRRPHTAFGRVRETRAAEVIQRAILGPTSPRPSPTARPASRAGELATLTPSTSGGSPPVAPSRGFPRGTPSARCRRTPPRTTAEPRNQGSPG